jgi:hypothetical protein
VDLVGLLDGDVIYGTPPPIKYDERGYRHVDVRRNSPVEEQPFESRFSRPIPLDRNNSAYLQGCQTFGSSLKMEMRQRG